LGLVKKAAKGIAPKSIPPYRTPYSVDAPVFLDLDFGRQLPSVEEFTPTG
jgi:hypothetical protein